MKSWNMETLSDLSYVYALYKWIKHKIGKGESNIQETEAEENMLKNLKELQIKYNCIKPEDLTKEKIIEHKEKKLTNPKIIKWKELVKEYDELETIT